jgi:hypothetical protein
VSDAALQKNQFYINVMSFQHLGFSTFLRGIKKMKIMFAKEANAGKP